MGFISSGLSGTPETKPTASDTLPFQDPGSTEFREGAGKGTQDMAQSLQDTAENLTYQNKFRAQGPELTTMRYQDPITAQYTQFTGQQQQQQQLANQLGEMAQGRGPNPANAQYQENINQANAQAAGLIASQKGISPALQNRMIAQQYGSAGQQAAGGGATMAAQQQLAAIGALQQQQNLQQQGTLQAQGVYTGALANQNAAINTGTLGTNQINAGVAQNNANAVNATQRGMMSAIGSSLSGSSATGMMGMAHGGPVGYASGGVASNAGMYANSPDPFSSMVPGGEKKDDGGGGINPMMLLALNKGGKVAHTEIHMPKNYADGGSVPSLGVDSNAGMYANSPDPFASMVPGAKKEEEGKEGGEEGGGGGMAGMMGGITKMFGMADGGAVDPNGPQSFVGRHLYAKGGNVLPPQNRMPELHGENFAHSLRTVPGKAKVKGDSIKNDTVPARLSPGEVIIPRSVMQSRDPVNNAAKFIQAILAKQGLKKS